MQARVRLIRTADNHELSQREFVQQSERRRLAEWAAADGRALLQALQNGYAALGAQIYDSEFLLYPFPDRGMHATGWLAAAFGLAPLAPRVSGQLSGSDSLTRALEWRTVDSTQPTLRWQAFPRPSDRAAAPAEMARVANVRYDLVIAEERALAPARIVYRGENLAEPQQRLSSPLRADGYYFWSVRSACGRLRRQAAPAATAQERLRFGSSHAAGPCNRRSAAATMRRICPTVCAWNACWMCWVRWPSRIWLL